MEDSQDFKNKISMEEIKDNEYIRTNQGTIAKIKDTEFEIETNIFGQILYENWIENNRWYEVIVKHSKNIIDLIEEGDYVNGRLVLQVDYKYKNVCLLIPLTDTKANTNIMWYGFEDIKAVVTHEQMKSVEYIVKEEQ